MRPRIDTFVLPEGDLVDRSVVVHRTADGVEFVRTPDERFEDLDGYRFAPNYVTIDGLRVHYVDEGPKDGPLVLLLHGQPTWSYLYRKMIPVLAAAGMRVVAWDNVGFGRSDKPVDPKIHTYARHVAWYHAILAALSLREINLFCQDWGGVIGLRVVADAPERFARVLAANTGLVVAPGGAGLTLPATVHMGTEPRRFHDAAAEAMTVKRGFAETFQWWIDYTLTSADFRPGDLVQVQTFGRLTEAEKAGYDAPFPSFVYAIAPHVFPAMLPTITDDNVAAWEALGRFDRPFLYLGGNFDPLGSPANQKRHVDQVPGAKGREHDRYDAGHFIQEELGETMAARMLRFVRENV